MRRSHYFWINLLLVLVGVVLGSAVAQLTSGVKFLAWLSYGLDFGTAAPATLDLGVFTLTIGARLTITVATIIFVALSLWIGRLIIKKR